MRIEIKKNERAILITFNTLGNEFESSYERNKFFRKLYGWNQIIPKQQKKYVYHRNGLLDEIPHMKISNSVFIVALEHMRKIEDFFKEWKRKVEYDMIEIMLERDRFLNMLKKKV